MILMVRTLLVHATLRTGSDERMKEKEPTRDAAKDKRLAARNALCAISVGHRRKGITGRENASEEQALSEVERRSWKSALNKYWLLAQPVDGIRLILPVATRTTSSPKRPLREKGHAPGYPKATVLGSRDRHRGNRRDTF